jgi:hypothetical protein
MLNNDIDELEKVPKDDDTTEAASCERTTSQMINDCFRHQHPEAYGRDPVPQGAVPWDLQCGRDHLVTAATSTIAEEPMGNPNASPIDS